MAALAGAGFPADRFVFLGFLPKRGVARAELLDRIADEVFTTVCYEAPGRTAVLLADLAGRCGTERPAAVGRELTKLYEEIRRGTLLELATYYEQHGVRGEVTIVIGGRGEEPPPPVLSESEQMAAIEELRGTGAPAAVAKELSKRLGISRQDAYRLLTR
jgi:16S rRNA (cytidine1402-2'-O)-methyltransferase